MLHKYHTLQVLNYTLSLSIFYRFVRRTINPTLVFTLYIISVLNSHLFLCNTNSVCCRTLCMFFPCAHVCAFFKAFALSQPPTRLPRATPVLAATTAPPVTSAHIDKGIAVQCRTSIRHPLWSYMH